MLKRPWPNDIVRAPAEPTPDCVNVFDGVYEPRSRRRRLIRTIEIMLTFALGMAALHFGAPAAIAIFVAIAEAFQ